MKTTFLKRPSTALFAPLVILTITLACCDGGRVLVFPMDGSHWVNMKVLIEGLHARQHNITVIRHNNSWYIAESSPLYNTITVPDLHHMDREVVDYFLSLNVEAQRGKTSLLKFLKMQWDQYSFLSDVHRYTCNLVMEILEDKELVKGLKDAQYDLILTDPATGGGVLLAHYLQLPMVLNVRWIPTGEGHFSIAPSPLSYIPLQGSGLSDHMTFMQRFKNFLFYTLVLYQQIFVVSHHYQDVCKKYMNTDCDIIALIQSADLWLMRVDFVFEFPRPTMPNVVYMGGFQCKPSRPLPPDLEEFVQSSGEHGVIIMSLGTVVNNLPNDIAEKIAYVFAQLPQKVIWRHMGEKPSTLGNNTLLVHWMPQNDLLGHSKVRAFVAHGGTNGVQEALYHGVPVVGVPLFYDQHDNLLRLAEKGAAKMLDVGNLERDHFHQALQDVLHDPSYRTNMQKLSRLHRDQPMAPLDRALFWVEFVMRHKGAAHLYSPSYQMPWYIYHSLDVIAALLAFTLMLVLTTFVAVRYLCCTLCCKRKIKHE